MNDREARQVAIRALEARGNKVRDVSSGQGRPKLSMVEIEQASSKRICSIKVANKALNGRIHYQRIGSGRYSVLSDVDLVLHVRPMVDGSVRVTMFDKQTVLAAFEKGYKVLEKAGKEHLPIWVSPEPESGWRQASSGFGDKALWSETTANGAPKPAPAPVSGGQQPHVRPLTIAEAKLAVAAKYETSPENVEIIVRG
jgi:hypothetical protein